MTLWSVILSGTTMFALLYWGLSRPLYSSLLVAFLTADTVWLFAAFYTLYTTTP